MKEHRFHVTPEVVRHVSGHSERCIGGAAAAGAMLGQQAIDAGFHAGEFRSVTCHADGSYTLAAAKRPGAPASSGPAKVSSEAFRDGWDRIFTDPGAP